MMASSKQRWIRSSSRNPCPVCKREKDGDCAISEDGQRVFCHHPKDYPKGEVVNGWAFTGNIRDGRAGHFVLHKLFDVSSRSLDKVVPLRPRTPEPASISEPWPAPPPAHLPDGHRIDYSPSQWTIWRDRTATDGSRERGERPRHLLDGKTEYSAGNEHWPLYGSDQIALAAGKWISDAEGPKCAMWLQAGGLVGVSQPGHDQSNESIIRRYRELVARDVAGAIYLADNDDAGRKKAQKLQNCAAAAGLPLLLLHAADVWPDLPEKGSIDDAPGTAEERVQALLDAIPDEVVHHQRLQEQSPIGFWVGALVAPAFTTSTARPARSLTSNPLPSPALYSILRTKVGGRSTTAEKGAALTGLLPAVR
jgi:hypothetical protein